MRGLAAIAIAVTVHTADAQTPAESAYLRTRREAASQFDSRREMTAQQKAVFADLERRFRSIVGRVSAPGFSGPGQFSADYTCRDAICSAADFLTFTRGARSLSVTNPVLLGAWLADHPDPDYLSTLDSALKSTRFLADALGGDMAVYKYADLPIPDARRRGVIAAMLVLRGQDDHRDPPDRVLITVARQSRVYLIEIPPVVAVDTLRACVAPLDSTLDALMADKPSEKIDQFDRAWESYRSCYQTNLSSIPGIDRIVRQVTTLVDSLSPTAAKNYGLSDQSALQGSWRVADARARMSNEPAMLIDGMVGTGTVEFASDTIRMRGLGHGDVLAYAFTLDTAATPRRIRMVDAAAPDSGRWVGLYRVSGDTLRLSLPIEHFGNRPIPPASFNAPNTAAYIFTRVPR